MKLRIKRFAATSAALLLALCVLAQPTATVQWSDSTAAVGDGVYEITFTGRILDGWHTYDLHSGFSSTVIAFEPSEGVELMGDPFEKVAAERRFDEIFGEEIGEYEGEIVLGQRVRLTAAEGVLRGNINWRSCQGDNCNMPEDWPFEIRLPAGSAGQDTAGDALHQSPLGDAADPAGEGLLGLILVAIGWGLLALLTPCVFPMIPMTVSFFLKGSESTSAGRFKASMYGLFIVLLYTVPIAAIILLTRLLGGDAVTADIFNWLATHWLPNLIFFIVFMVFAASFFGAFEITLPGWMVNKSDRNADRGGLLGVFFMALTLVLVSFSCTGPIVGSAIIGATGSGKTTLVSLIPRFYDATEGSVEIFGRPVGGYPRDALRGRGAMVMQKAQLFGGPIRSNLLWGNKDATDADLWAALETAQAADFVRAKPLGLDEPVEQGGRNLSGGQKQRLTIARALVGKPDILILDDSASALDYATDAALRKALAALPGALTVFIVSQRAASLQHADQILVLDDGHLVGIGTHSALRSSCPVYEEIYESQFKKGEAEA